MRANVGLLLAALSLGGGAAAADKGTAERRGGKKSGGRGAEAEGATRAQVERLRRGAERFEAADYAAAHKELAPLADAPLRNRDLALYLLASSEALQTPPERKDALEHFRAVAGMRKSAWRRPARARAADLLYELGRDAEARAAYREVLGDPDPAIEPAVARFRLAEIAARAGDRGPAIDGLRRVYVEHPEHPLADRALARIRELDASYEVPLADRIDRARRLSDDRQWQRAVDELNALPKDMPPALRVEADYRLGMTHFKMRRGYDIAAEKLLAVWPNLASDKQADAMFHGARAFSRADQDDRAIVGYKDLLARFPHSRPAAEAAFLIGWLDFNRGRYRDAIPGLEACLARYGSSAFADDAHWYLGLARWMLGDAAGALTEFEWMSRRGGALDGGKGRYWRGRALAKLDRRDEAVAEWRRVAADYPFTYYAQLARVRLAALSIHVDPFGREVGAGAAPAAPAAPAEGTRPVGAADAALAADADVARVDELLAADLRFEAARSLDRVDADLVKRFGAARALPVLFDRYERADDFFHVHRLAESHSPGALRRDPHADAGARSWWERVYPLAYRRFIERYGPSGNNPPYYLYTIMQKESAYNPHDVSYADAIGLLQMIPPTSRRVGERIGRPYTDDVLYDPEGNIQFGAWYIGHLLEKFKGQVALGAGSYNAGPRAMMRWVKQNGERPLDEFIELCSYTQTREYMKKALAIYARYEWLYGQRDYLPDEKVDARYVENEIDY